MNIATGVLSEDLLTMRPITRFSVTSGKLVIVELLAPNRREFLQSDMENAGKSCMSNKHTKCRDYLPK
ncbi:hypothetical protein N9B39_01780 [bacterium]|nr:hypothetical protein [bacterium]MDA7915149.1 hypothetical protein [bacterium]MDB4394212.1 hypothetical protein [Rhodopirellula sp.]